MSWSGPPAHLKLLPHGLVGSCVQSCVLSYSQPLSVPPSVWNAFCSPHSSFSFPPFLIHLFCFTLDFVSCRKPFLTPGPEFEPLLWVHTAPCPHSLVVHTVHCGYLVRPSSAGELLEIRDGALFSSLPTTITTCGVMVYRDFRYIFVGGMNKWMSEWTLEQWFTGQTLELADVYLSFDVGPAT